MDKSKSTGSSGAATPNSGRGKCLDMINTSTPARPLGKAGASPSGSSTSTAASQSKKKKKTLNSEQFTSYVFRILRNVKPGVRITRKAMSIMNSFVLDAFERIAAEAGKLCMYAKKDTLTSKEIRTAVRLVLPGDLAKHAILEGVDAVQRWTANTGGVKRV